MEQLAPLSDPGQLTTKNQYSDIVLTPEETAEALRLAREEKWVEQNKKEWFEKIKQQPIGYVTASHMYQQLLLTRSRTGKPYKVDDDNNELVHRLCLYFAKDPAFNTEKYDLKKGILLMGPSGCGKSHIMSFFFHNQNLSYRMAQCRDVCNEWLMEGKIKDMVEESETVINRYSRMIDVPTNANPWRQTSIGLCFDDLGTEERQNSFGTQKNVMAEIIMNRYDNKLPQNATHIVTNLGPDELEERYGTRFRDRLRESYNVIRFSKDAKSRR